MNTDIRIKADFLDHPKLVKLKRRCGNEGLISIIRLWQFTAKYHPKGKLNDMEAEDIEIASCWNGDPGKFTAALVELKLLDFSGTKYSVHDWKEHNSFAYYAPERSAQARHAVKVREELKHKKRSSDRSSDRSSPSPNPLPSPKPKETNMPPVGAESEKPAEKGKKKKRKSTPIEDRKMKTDSGRLVQQWYRQYKKYDGTSWSGDVAKMGGQAKTLIRDHEYPVLIMAMNYLLEFKPHEQYRQHTWDFFVRKISTLIIEAKQNGYFPDPELVKERANHV